MHGLVHEVNSRRSSLRASQAEAIASMTQLNRSLELGALPEGSPDASHAALPE
jgi:hypothetical protein